MTSTPGARIACTRTSSVRPSGCDPMRAVVLAARLGWIDHADRIGLYGDLLIVGAATPGRDTDVPRAVLEAAAVAGLLPLRTP